MNFQCHSNVTHKLYSKLFNSNFRFKSDKSDDGKIQKVEESHPTFSNDRISKDLSSNPDKTYHPEKFRDDAEVPMQDPKVQKYKEVDQMYEKFMELKDYDAQGRPTRATYQDLFFMT